MTTTDYSKQQEMLENAMKMPYERLVKKLLEMQELYRKECAQSKWLDVLADSLRSGDEEEEKEAQELYNEYREVAKRTTKMYEFLETVQITKTYVAMGSELTKALEDVEEIFDRSGDTLKLAEGAEQRLSNLGGSIHEFDQATPMTEVIDATAGWLEVHFLSEEEYNLLLPLI